MGGRAATLLGLTLSIGCKPGPVCEGGTEDLEGACVARRCVAPFVVLPNGGCDAPRTQVLVPARAITVGPSDWEAEGRIRPHHATTPTFRIDAHEVTEARYFAWSQSARRVPPTRRPVSNVSSAEAAQFCHAHEGRLPTEDEWMAAAAGGTQRRYPWGDTGAVCGRGSWGKAGGQCGTAAQADAVGAHPRGATPEGIFDLAGNVSEWVTLPGGSSFDAAKGGSWRSPLATELRNWARSEYPHGSRDRAIGFRCVYDLK